jgi:cation transport ATPase
MGLGTDVARESADMVLLNDLAKFTETLEIARWARRTILLNFAGTIAVDMIGIGLAAAGLRSDVGGLHSCRFRDDLYSQFSEPVAAA